jgi:hypothetical protein
MCTNCDSSHGCMKLLDYLTLFFSNPDKQTDFFMEIGFPEKWFVPQIADILRNSTTTKREQLFEFGSHFESAFYNHRAIMGDLRKLCEDGDDGALAAYLMHYQRELGYGDGAQFSALVLRALPQVRKFVERSAREPSHFPSARLHYVDVRYTENILIIAAHSAAHPHMLKAAGSPTPATLFKACVGLVTSDNYPSYLSRGFPGLKFKGFRIMHNGAHISVVRKEVLKLAPPMQKAMLAYFRHRLAVFHAKTPNIAHGAVFNCLSRNVSEMVVYSAIFMDIYLLSRMMCFMGFGVSRAGRSTDIAVVYAGEHHVWGCDEFFAFLNERKLGIVHRTFVQFPANPGSRRVSRCVPAPQPLVDALEKK